jgi:Glycosyltransferase family 87
MRLLSATAAVLLFAVSWGLLHYGFFAREQITDTPVYRRYGEAMSEGRVPYRDFSLEYPPGALPVFLLPAFGGGGIEAYSRRFDGLMAGLAVACVLLVAVATTASWAPIVVAAAPLLLGSVVVSRFDFWPAALTAAAVVLLVLGRFRVGLGTLGLATAAKLYPAVVVPIAVAHVWRLRGRREALGAAAAFLGVLAAVVVPFAAVAPGGVWQAFWQQAGRPLQIESLGASLMLAAHHVFGFGLMLDSSHGSQNLSGRVAEALATLSTLGQAAALATIWVWHARGPANRDRLLAASAAAVCAFVAFGKVLSPQFLIWLIPFVPLVGGRRGLVASSLLAVSLLLTQLWFPSRYWDLVPGFDPAASWLVLARDLVLVALTLVLAARVRPGRAHSG